MMSVELQILVAGVTVIATILGGYFALARLVVAQFTQGLDERFKAMAEARKAERAAADERLARIELSHADMIREVLELKADLPREYVRREDHIRYETVVNAKLDALFAQISLVAERQLQGRS